MFQTTNQLDVDVLGSPKQIRLKTYGTTQATEKAPVKNSQEDHPIFL